MAGAGCGRCFKVCSREVLQLVGIDEDVEVVVLAADNDDDDDEEYEKKVMIIARKENRTDRPTLSGLLERYFTSLFQKNVHNMKWKKFFYKQLCDRAEVIMCPARNCQSCADYKNYCSSGETVPVMVLEEAIF